MNLAESEKTILARLQPVITPLKALVIIIAGVSAVLLDWLTPVRAGNVSEGFAFLIPLIIAAVGAGASYLKARAAGKSVQEQQSLYNQWVANRQNGINDILEKITANGYDPFGAQTSTSNSKSLSTTLQNMLSQTSSRPVITSQYQPIESKLRSLVAGKLAAPTALPPGYAANQVRNINTAFAGATQAARNEAARKGLSGEATFGANMPIESDRAGKISDALAQLPLMERDMRNQDISQAEGLTQAFGLGSDSTTKSSGTSQTSGSSSSTLTSPPNFAGLISALTPPMPGGVIFPNANTTGANVAQAGGDLASILAWLWQNGAFNSDKGGQTVNQPVH